MGCSAGVSHSGTLDGCYLLYASLRPPVPSFLLSFPLFLQAPSPRMASYAPASSMDQSRDAREVRDVEQDGRMDGFCSSVSTSCPFLQLRAQSTTSRAPSSTPHLSPRLQTRYTPSLRLHRPSPKGRLRIYPLVRGISPSLTSIIAPLFQRPQSAPMDPCTSHKVDLQVWTYLERGNVRYQAEKMVLRVQGLFVTYVHPYTSHICEV